MTAKPYSGAQGWALARRRAVREVLLLMRDLRSYRRQNESRMRPEVAQWLRPVSRELLQLAWGMRTLKPHQKAAVQAWGCLERATRFASAALSTHRLEELMSAMALAGAAWAYANEAERATRRGRTGGRPATIRTALAALIAEKPEYSSTRLAGMARARGVDVDDSSVRRVRRALKQPGKT